jgi:hypothetical protein
VLLLYAVEPISFGLVVFALVCARPLVPRRDLELVVADLAIGKPSETQSTTATAVTP